MEVYENFISYRRKESLLEVKNIYDALSKRGYVTFCDIFSLSSGNFSNDLKIAIDNCTNYILVLNENSLTENIDENDWLYREISEALEKKKNIICIFIGETKFPDKLPSAIEDIRYQNGLKFDVLYFDQFIDKLVSQFLVSSDERSHSNDEEDFIIDNGVLLKYVGEAKIVKIPNSVKVIGTEAFKDQTRITKVALPESLILIKRGAFERCGKLSFIEFPEKVREIEEKAFSRCYKLAYVRFNSELEVIGKEAFSFCEKIKTVTLPKGLKQIAASTFNDCGQLTALSISKENEYYTTKQGLLYNKELIKIIRCPENFSEETIILSEKVKIIGEYAFYKCKNILSVVIPNKTEEIQSYAFKDTTGIENLLLPSSIRHFELNAIDGWESDQRIIMGRKFNAALKYRIEERLYQEDLELIDQFEHPFCLVTTVFESKEEAENMARHLLSKKLIVSGQINTIQSLYFWDNKICSEPEYKLTCFTHSALYKAIEKFIITNHSYEVCEIICTPILNTSDMFGNWIQEYVKYEQEN